MSNIKEHNVAIYLSYHKPAKIIENDVLIPIQSGKRIANFDLGILGDNTGDNLSHFGDSLNELTVLYWIWKNDSIHKYLGLCHYRRIFIFKSEILLRYSIRIKKIPYLSEDWETEFGLRKSDILSVINKADIVVSRYWYNPFGRNQGEQYIFAHGEEGYNTLVNGVKNFAPDYYPYLMKCLKGKKLIVGNMFLMRRDLLNDYCNWLFPLLEKIIIDINPFKVSSYNIRHGFIAERLFHIYIEKLKVDHPEIIVRHFPILFIEDTSPEVRSLSSVKNQLPVLPLIYFCNEDMIPIFCVHLESLFTVVSSYYFYDVVILSDSLSERSKKILIDRVSQKNIGIRFFNTSHIARNDPKKENLQYNSEYFLKLNLPNIFPDYDKILLLPPNTIIIDDPALIMQECSDEFFAAVTISLEIMALRLLKSNVEKPYQKFNYSSYFKNIVGLQIKDIEQYFDSSIMVMNIKKIRTDKLESKFLEIYIKNDYFFREQDVFNKVFQGCVKYLPQRWNVIIRDHKHILSVLPSHFEQMHKESLEDPAIIHIKLENGMPKFFENHEDCELFWKFARSSLYYEKLLTQFLYKSSGINNNHWMGQGKKHNKIIFFFLKIRKKISGNYPLNILGK